MGYFPQSSSSSCWTHVMFTEVSMIYHPKDTKSSWKGKLWLSISQWQKLPPLCRIKHSSKGKHKNLKKLTYSYKYLSKRLLFVHLPHEIIVSEDSAAKWKWLCSFLRRRGCSGIPEKFPDHAHDLIYSLEGVCCGVLVCDSINWNGMEVKECFPMSSVNLHWHSLEPFPHSCHWIPGRRAQNLPLHFPTSGTWRVLSF